jgi:hypothetical protein
MSQEIMELTSKSNAYPILVMILFWHFPQALQRVEHVAAPQHEAATEMILRAVSD